jgi:tetratricopeptide (TPR) repeat protein
MVAGESWQGPMEEKERDYGAGAGAAVAGALAADGDLSSRARADAFLEEQTRLTRLQIEDMRAENRLRNWSLRVRHISDVMKLAFELALAFILVAIAVGLGAAIWNASQDDGLVVESFSVPPDLAGRGLTGEVVAAKLLDKLSALQAATVSNRASSSYANNWDGDIKLQIPDTGISIGEFNRSLHAWLGHQTRITGEIWRTPTGLAVTARAGSDTSPTFTGAEADLDKLMQQAAESVYRATQPYRYAVYLTNANRAKEAEAAYRALIADGSPTDRAWAYIGIENIYANRGDIGRALRTANSALALKPDFIMVYVNVASLEAQLQHDEAALAAQRKVVALAEGPRDPELGELPWKIGRLASNAALAGDVGDYRAQLDYDRQIEALPNFSGLVENARQNDVVAYAFLHDGAGAREAYADLPPSSDPQVVFGREGSRSFADVLLGRWQTLLEKRTMFEAILAKLGAVGTVAARRQFWPIAADALAESGDLAGAHKLIDRTPADCILCLRVRGHLDALGKNWGGADYWFARAARAAPSPPFVWTDWGHMLLAKGDDDGAIAKFALAHEKGPHFADPLEMWGEALIAKNRSDLALAKFEEAAKYAPNWGRLHLKWGEALLYTGDKSGAQKQFALAAHLDLGAEERAELGRIK